MKHPSHSLPQRAGTFFRRLALLTLSLLLTAAKIGDGYAPFALALTAASGTGIPALFCLVGDGIGAWLFLDFQPGLRHLAAAVLIVSASLCFADTKIYHRRYFRPAAAAGMTALVQCIYLFRRPLFHTAVFALSLALQTVLTRFFIQNQQQFAELLRRHPPRKRDQWTKIRREAEAVLGYALALSVMKITGRDDFSLGGMILAGVMLHCTDSLSPAQGAAVGFCAGLFADLTAVPDPRPLYTTLCAGGGALASFFAAHSVLSSLGYGVSAVTVPTLFGADMPLIFLWEALPAMVIHLLPRRSAAPRRAVPAEKEKRTAAGENRWEKSAAAFRELYDSFFCGTEPAPPENPSVIFDRAAEKVCRNCPIQQRCWQEDYNTTYNAFNDASGAILQRGEAKAGDFPIHFTSRCMRLQEFLAGINAELRIFLQRQQYRRRLQETRRCAREQYAQLGEILSGAGASAAVEASARQPKLGYRVGSSLRPRKGQTACGDQLDLFEVGETLYLLLSDGMGSGMAAHREAAMTVRLLRQFLTAGIEPAPALKTLNTALALRGEEGGGFTTIDLLQMQCRSGAASLYKYGAAPSYLKRAGTVTRFIGSGFPVGLEQGDRPPEQTKLSLTAGSYFVMISDGVADEKNDRWLMELLRNWNGGEASELTRLILAESEKRDGLDDDCAVLVLRLTEESQNEKSCI